MAKGTALKIKIIFVVIMQKEKKIIIYGVGRFAEYAAYLFEHDSPYEVVGFCIESSFLKKDKTSQIKQEVINFDTIEDTASPEEHDLFIAVGDNLIRERIFSMARKKGYYLASYISSKAMTWPNLKIGENSFVGEGTVVQPLIEIGENCLLFGARIGHHSKIGDHALLSGCVIGGNVAVGNFSFIGIHASIKENTKIGTKNIIGMGAVINSNTKDNEIYTSAAAVKRKIRFQDLNKDS